MITAFRFIRPLYERQAVDRVVLREQPCGGHSVVLEVRLDKALYNMLLEFKPIWICRKVVVRHGPTRSSASSLRISTNPNHYKQRNISFCHPPLFFRSEPLGTNLIFELDTTNYVWKLAIVSSVGKTSQLYDAWNASAVPLLCGTCMKKNNNKTK